MEWTLVNSYKMTRAAELEALPIFRDFLDSVCKEHGIGSEFRYDLKLAMDEACTNIITHGYAGMNPGSIMMEVQFQPSHIRLSITDFGLAFEPVETAAPDVNALLEDRVASGFGLYFIYQTMDEVEYRTTVDCNMLTLVKRRHAPDAA